MAGAGRNQQCPCGSGRKVKHCCGEVRGPSQELRDRSFLAGQRDLAVDHLALHSRADVGELLEELLDLPQLDHRLVVPLPRLITPELSQLQDAIRAEDDEAVEATLPAVVAGCDTPAARACFARAVIELRDARRLGECVAAAALFDLSLDDSILIRASVVEAAAIDAGAARTSSGLLLAAG
jgi:SEC-C motif